eukprot:9075481-Pyramimonas_sp.AAC.1
MQLCGCLGKPSTSCKRKMRRLRLVARRQVAIEFFQLDRAAPVIVLSTKHTSACPQEGSHDIAYVRSFFVAADIWCDSALRNALEVTVSHDIVSRGVISHDVSPD